MQTRKGSAGGSSPSLFFFLLFFDDFFDDFFFFVVVEDGTSKSLTTPKLPAAASLRKVSHSAERSRPSEKSVRALGGASAAGKAVEKSDSPSSAAAGCAPGWPMRTLGVSVGFQKATDLGKRGCR